MAAKEVEVEDAVEGEEVVLEGFGLDSEQEAEG